MTDLTHLSFDSCAWCRGIMTKSRTGKAYHRALHPTHPRIHRRKNQGCAVRPICTYRRNRAELCERFQRREHNEDS